jgi:hypothetical protein
LVSRRTRQRIGAKRFNDIMTRLTTFHRHSAGTRGGTASRRHPSRFAELVFADKVVFDDGAIQEIVVWRVPEPVPRSSHGFEYRLF